MRILTFLILMSFVSNSNARRPSPEEVQSVCEELKNVLHEGDLLFIDIRNPIFKTIALTTQGWTSHVGLAFHEGEKWLVGESTTPTLRFTPLCDFVSRSDSARVAVKRNRKTLRIHEKQHLFQFTESHLGFPYDYRFDYENEDSYFCSKLTYKAYLEATGQEIGEVQRFEEILDAHSPGLTKFYLKVFWSTWFSGSIPYDQKTVSPQSQFEDPDLELVYESSSIF